MAVFDTGPGIVGLYEKKRDFLNYYIDDKFEYYGLYKRDTVNKRLDELMPIFKRKEKIYVLDFDAINYFKEDGRAIYGKKAIREKLKDKKILCLCSKLTESEKTLNEFTDFHVDYFSVPLLINACNDQIADEIIEKICHEVFQDFDYKDYDLIFLASSGLHLKREFFENYFGVEVYSNTDAVLEEYEYKKENYVRDFFYTTFSKMGFYSRAEKYLRDRGILKDRELLNVSNLRVKK
ncbi:hypothetical protein KQI68_08410 [Peptoniphilus sp. MSJ-1]|uniref:Uncharacterized protein n=1 Tax=Peptoniphilus ovalis TaxID=2841503 RepID=A0ABS6FKZ1_9FIRM|nr:hypothetical protein [Peptoniphilus ovalis]MBU5669855.1 hypothetical protein [Peptoniphilus ovalis]